MVHSGFESRIFPSILVMVRPKVLLSRCFLEAVRYNEEKVDNDFVNKLKKYVDYIDFCPEVDIGLGIPRKRLIIVKNNGSKKLIQPETGVDLTKKIARYAEKVLKSLSVKDIDGFLLKANSPSCGVGSAKLYKNGKLIGKDYGFFAKKIKEKFYYLPIEDEVRLKNKDIREHFLIRIFAFAELRELVKNQKRELIDFHTKHKYLLMTYSPKYLKELEELIKDAKIDIVEKMKLYKEKFYKAFFKKPSPNRYVNTLLHLIRHISPMLTQKEKKHLLFLIENYSKKKIHLKVIIELLKNLSHKFENEYIPYQKYLEPYPDELEELKKS
ncbi:MAG: DUF523 and DUF1722 domain-containing protein [Candidatus Omnitrophica bacterium]|nr:DUF523 and DUF1722 domain-containing protein [Candidatus Omnitrophota bacterium]